MKPHKLKEVNKDYCVAILFVLSCCTLTRFKVRSSSVEDYICCSSNESLRQDASWRDVLWGMCVIPGSEPVTNLWKSDVEGVAP